MNSKKLITLLLSIVIVSVFIFTGCDNSPGVPTAAPQTEGTEPTPVPTKELAQATPTLNPGDILNSYTVEIDKDIINILLIGNDSDSEDGDGNGRSDTTMVLQINRVDKTMKLISFMRDMVFDVPGVGITSLNNANYYGGHAKVAKLLKDEFDISIDYYASVSFDAFQAVMDVIGQISIDQSVNQVPDISADKAAQMADVTTDMTPKQALDYVRNRHDSIIDAETGYTLYSDEARNYRQRMFISSVWERVKSFPTFTIPVGVYSAVTYINTDMDTNTMITLIKEMMDADATIETLGLPARRSAEKPYYSLYEDLNTEEILSKTEIEARYSSASDKDSFDSYEDWKDAHYKVSHIIGWNVGRTTEAIKQFLVTN
ncbi:MAG: LCP family protein [Eubacteriales bacterium]